MTVEIGENLASVLRAVAFVGMILCVVGMWLKLRRTPPPRAPDEGAG